MAKSATAMNDKRRMFIMVTLKMIVLSCTAAAVAVSAPAMADTKTRIVRHNDLDLSTEKGQQRLASRVKIAVEQVCAGPLAFTIQEKQDLARCEREAMARAKSQANNAIANYQGNKRLAVDAKAAIVGN
jgi:UrcA family protein